MYILFVLLFINVKSGVEEVRGSYQTMEQCWEQAQKVERSSEVFNVRCQLVEDK